MYDVKVIADSISPQGHRLTTLECTFPRFILAEVNTHRMFSRNSASSRAIPVPQRIEQIQADPFMPVAFGANKAGMQAGEDLNEIDMAYAKSSWQGAIRDALGWAQRLVNTKVHKQWANRVIETYAWHTAVISSTEWGNHDGLRIHPAASPEYQVLAKGMRVARNGSTPRVLKKDEWHLPYVIGQDGCVIDENDFHEAHRMVDVGRFDSRTDPPLGQEITKIFRKVSVGRCAAVSYERQQVRNFEKDVKRYGDMHSGGHMSPLEHVARPMTDYEYNDLFKQKEVMWSEKDQEWKWIGKATGNGNDPLSNEGNWLHFCGNFQGFIQDRKMIPNEHDFSKIARVA